MDILLAYVIPKLIVLAIQVLYTGTFVGGVLQGDTLVHFLFIIALDYAMRRATKDTHSKPIKK